MKIIESGIELKSNDEYWNSPLFEAATTGNSEIVKLLLEKGVDPNYQDYAGMSALYYAVDNGHLNIVELLLDNGAKIDMRDGYEDQTPLCVAVKYENFAIVELLVNRGADPKAHLVTHHLDLAANINDDKIKELIYKARGLTDNEYELYNAVKSGDVKKVNELLTEKTKAMICPYYNQTLLHVAAHFGHLDIVKILIQMNCDIDAKDSSNRTPLTETIRDKHSNVAEYLIDRGADVNIITKDKYTALYWAIFNDMADTVKLIIKSGIDKQILQSEFAYALRKANMEVVEAFIVAGADVDILDEQGYTVLINAVHSGNLNLVKKLVEMGLNVNQPNDEGWTPLLHSMENPDITKFLYEHGADPCVKNNRGDTVFLNACMYGMIWLIKDLIEKKPALIDEKGENGWSSLHYAAWHGRVEASRLLLEKGADLHALDDSGKTPLDLAVSQGNDKLVDFLKSQVSSD